jgi:serine/threonine protein kinase
MQSLDEDTVQELVERGFTDRSANLIALNDSQGNVNAATTKLLMQLPNFIGQGISGKAFFPALPCKDNRIIPSNYVSKLVTQANADKELLKAEKIKQYLPDDALYVLDTCESSVKENIHKLWRDRLVFSKYGGQDLTFLEYLHDLYFHPELILEREITFEHIAGYKKLLTSLRYLRERVDEMNKKGFYHNDIQWENIIYNEEEGKSYLIDFEAAAHIQASGPSDIEFMDAIIDEIDMMTIKIEGVLLGRGRKKSRKGRKKRNKGNTRKRGKKK